MMPLLTRRVRRVVGAGIAVVAALAVGATPALAKPWDTPGAQTVAGWAMITGPGTKVPVVITGRAAMGLDGRMVSEVVASGFSQLLELAGVVPKDGSQGAWYSTPQNRSALGPRYALVWTLHGDGPDAPLYSVRQDLYPKAPGHPWVYTPAGQRIAGFPVPPAWWSAPMSLGTMLAPYGLTAAPRAAGSALRTVPVMHGTRLLPWVVLWGCLAGLAIAGLIALVALRPRRTSRVVGAA